MGVRGGGLTIAVVCASNMNRSMEAHHYIQREGFRVESYGTGGTVKLPGLTMDVPNTYPFETNYHDILTDLKKQSVEFFTRIGVLAMLRRNREIKRAPESFQDACKQGRQWDVVLALEERVFASCLEALTRRRKQSEPKPLPRTCIINLPVQDTREDAVVGALQALKLCEALEERAAKDWHSVVQEFAAQTNLRMFVEWR